MICESLSDLLLPSFYDILSDKNLTIFFSKTPKLDRPDFLPVISVFFLHSSGCWPSSSSIFSHLWSRYSHLARSHAWRPFSSKTVLFFANHRASIYSSIWSFIQLLISFFLSTRNKFCWIDVQDSWKVFQFRFPRSCNCVWIFFAYLARPARCSQGTFW